MPWESDDHDNHRLKKKDSEVARSKVTCYDSPWTDLLTSGDSGCHQWTAVGVSSDTLGGVNINRTTWERSCQVHDINT